MLPPIPDLHKITKKDVKKTYSVLGEAFRDDPIWKRIIGDDEEKWSVIFEVPVRYCLKYGAVYAPSENIEAAAGWLPGKYTSMSFIRLILSGAFFSAWKLGSEIAKKIAAVFSRIDEDRKKYTQGMDYVYLYIIGVLPEYQGQGFGSQLVTKMLEKLDEQKIPVYLETETEKNVTFYQKLGFEVLGEFKTEMYDLPMWELLRKPQ